MVVDQKGYTKHYYNGGERFASRIGGEGLRLIDKPVNMLVYNRDMADVRSEYIPKPSDDLQTSPYIPLFEDGKPNYKTDEGSSVFIDHTNRIDQYLESVTHMLDRPMEHNPYSLEILYDLRIDRGKPTEVYYCHTDHLGSSSWITDDWGDAVQYLQYLPFGELWTDQRYTEWSARYTFSGKEKDAETGYSYFGARYYDANLSIWLSVDPLANLYPYQTPYAYCNNNPIMRIDPNGMSDGWIDDGNGSVFWDQNTNSQEELNINYAGKSGYSYVSDPDNAKAYTLPNGDGKLLLNSWKEYPIEDGLAGPKIELEFIPSDNNSNCGWVQTYSSNIPDANSDNFGRQMPGSSMDNRVDFQTIDKNNVNVPYWNPAKNSRILIDIPGRSYNKGATTSVIWNAQSSVITNGNRSVTVGWGFTIDSRNSGSYSSPIIINNPSPFHRNTINLLK